MKRQVLQQIHIHERINNIFPGAKNTPASRTHYNFYLQNFVVVKIKINRLSKKKKKNVLFALYNAR